jgi:hypothetical protein
MYGTGKVFPVYALDSRERYPNSSEKEQIEIVSAIFRQHGYTICSDPNDADYYAYWEISLKDNGVSSYTVTDDYVRTNKTYTHMIVANFSLSKGGVLWEGGAVIVQDNVNLNMMNSTGLKMAFEAFPNSK